MPRRLPSAVAGRSAYAGSPPLPAHDRPDSAVQADAEKALHIAAGTAFQLALTADPVRDPDDALSAQRLAIARALLKQPKVLIFDEATSSLDARTAKHFAGTINQRKGKVTMLFITHAIPRSLKVDDVVRIGRSLNAVPDRQESVGHANPMSEVEGRAT